jgi:hypothetical protein
MVARHAQHSVPPHHSQNGGFNLDHKESVCFAGAWYQRKLSVFNLSPYSELQKDVFCTSITSVTPVFKPLLQSIRSVESRLITN